MLSFKEFLRLQEELWLTTGPQDNPSNPGTKRKDAKDPYNHKFGSAAGMSVPVMGQQPAPQKMKSK